MQKVYKENNKGGGGMRAFKDAMQKRVLVTCGFENACWN
jgi:hypothetical protein